jgi:hypothetical protein
VVTFGTGAGDLTVKTTFRMALRFGIGPSPGTLCFLTVLDLLLGPASATPLHSSSSGQTHLTFDRLHSMQAVLGPLMHLYLGHRSAHL